MSNQEQRRSLSFQKLDEAAEDARTLLSNGYSSAGSWDLSTTCGHLVEWMRFPMDGFPRTAFPMRVILAVMRVTVGPRMLRKVLAEKTMKSGIPTAPATVPAGGGDASTAVQELCETIRRLQTHEGPLHPSPLFGEMDRQTAIQLQLVHCAHHLSFLLPG